MARGAAPTEFGRYLTDLLEQRGLSQASLARQAGVPKSNIQTWMGRRQSPPAVRELQDVAKVLQVDPWDLMAAWLRQGGYPVAAVELPDYPEVRAFVAHAADMTDEDREAVLRVIRLVLRGSSSTA